MHRAIKAVLKNEKYKPGKWDELGMHCSMTERRADEATRDVESWLKCYFMQDKVGEVFNGTISGVTGFGVFVALDDIYVEGLVHVTELGDDYFHFDAAKHQMLGERTGQALPSGRQDEGKGGAGGSGNQPGRFRAGEGRATSCGCAGQSPRCQVCRRQIRAAAKSQTPRPAAAPRRKAKPKTGQE